MGSPPASRGRLGDPRDTLQTPALLPTAYFVDDYDNVTPRKDDDLSVYCGSSTSPVVVKDCAGSAWCGSNPGNLRYIDREDFTGPAWPHEPKNTR